MNGAIVFSIIAAAVTVGGVLLAAGVLKGRINHNTELNKAQEEQLKELSRKA